MMTDSPVLLVTGAARGIGRATALEFAGRGYHVALVDVLQQELTDVSERVEALGVGALSLCGDLSDLGFAEHCIEQTVERWGRLDVLVNNAVWREQTTMREISLESWERTLRIGLTVPAYLTRWAAPAMEAVGKGVVINISSINAAAPRGNAPAYVAAKGGLESLTYELACLYGPAGIRVLAVCPGAIDTELSRDYTDESGNSLTRDMRNWSEDMIPLGRWGRSEEIARLIAMLAGDEAAYVTGTTIVADGGWSRNSMPYSFKSRMQ